MTKNEIMADALWACLHRCRTGPTVDGECRGCRVLKYRRYDGVAGRQPRLMAMEYESWTKNATIAAIACIGERADRRGWWCELKAEIEHRAGRPVSTRWWSTLPRSKPWTKLFRKTGASRPSGLASHNGSAEMQWELLAGGDQCWAA